MISFTLAAYWDARPDSLEECTEDVRRFIAGLAQIDPFLANWYEVGRSRKDALKEVDAADTQRLRDLLLKGRNRRDIGRQVIEELGFTLSLWSRASNEVAAASIRIHCGCYSKFIGNNVLIDLPCNSARPKWVENASALLALVAEIWHPKWAGIMSSRAVKERDYNADYPFVDWMVYVPRAVRAMPLPTRVESLKGLGSIIIVQPDPPVGDNAEELSLIRKVESLLAD
jgi:hypothetical protein